MDKLKVLSLFSGIGGLDLGLERTGGFEVVAFCEQDKDCQTILKQHWPNVPIFGDVRTLRGCDVPPIDVMAGGFPCQDISVGGKKKGIIEGERSSLWKEYWRLIDEKRPKWVIIENVGNLTNLGLGIVLRDLAKIGYDAEWHCIRASDVGLPHKRERLFIVSYPSKQRFDGHFEQDGHLQIDKERHLAEMDSERAKCFFESFEAGQVLSYGQLKAELCSFPSQFTTISELRRVTDGVSSKLDEKDRRRRIKQLGNAVVPQIAEAIGRMILRYKEL